MFLGHFALAFAAKRAAPATSLGTLTASAQLLDLIWPGLVLAGIEQVRIEPGNTAFTPLNFVSYPYSHGLLPCLAWSALAAAVYYLATRYRRGACIVAALVASHWLLDFLTHRPDLPLYPGSSTYAGLGLWNSVPATIAIETLMYIAGVWLYRPTSLKSWSLVAFLAVIYVMNIVGSPPPSPQAVAGVTLSMWLIVLWAWWCDRPGSKPYS